ncbi:polysaccharide lyase family 7 protein [Pseudomonas sp. LPH60]|uniref:polysaccharide lyase family 7 protein n=1 Tax=Pseudomonas sp. LPH60 TaxID=3065906 RepID=UPI00273B6B9B|nr:polysaccharide lyase family 7 protein [Pseudomonas sp. LPH60]MDP4572257.1 polysaccharide lyase family 7 protein [Pseudomonas sp. LPH60]
MNNFGNIIAHGTLYLYPERPPQNLFWIDHNGHTNYWCSVQGGTSGTSKTPRTESRQTLPDSPVSFNWIRGSAKHSMAGRVRVEKAPSSGKVIVGQIHALKAPNPFLMVIWWNGIVRVETRQQPGGFAQTLLEKSVPLGQPFSYSLQVDALGELSVTLDTLSANAAVSTTWNKYPFYFKAGSYVIDNKGPETEGGWVVYESFDVFNGELQG